MVSVEKEGEDRREFLLEAYKAIADDVIKVYETTIKVLEEGIHIGAANVPLSLLSLQSFTDLLHGGAYKKSAYELPYYTESVQNQLQPTLANNFIVQSPVTITLDDGRKVTLPQGAKPEQQEIIINSAEATIFPRFTSDQNYYLTKEWVSLFFTTALAQGFATNVRTLVFGDTLREGSGITGRRQRTRFASKDKASLAAAEDGASGVS